MTDELPGQRWDAWGLIMLLLTGAWVAVTLYLTVARPGWEPGIEWWGIPALLLVGVVKVWRMLQPPAGRDEGSSDE